MSGPSESRALRAAQEGGAPVARRSLLGWPGFAFVAITVFLAVGAVNSQNNLLFWVFGVAVAGVIVSGVISGSGLMGVRLTAHPIGWLECGVPAELAYTVRSNARRFSVFGLEIRERPAHRFEAAFRGIATTVVHLAPGTRRDITLRFTPVRRGVLELERVTAESRFPFGLLIKSLEFESPRSALVAPAKVELRSGVFATGRTGGSGASTTLARTGAGTEFYSIREYAPGDPRRAIAWRPSARRGDLLVIERNEPRSRAAWVWVTSPPSGTENGDPVAERALAIALALVRQGARRQTGVGLWMPWAGIRIEPDTGRAFERRVAETLARVDLASDGGGSSRTDGPPHGHGVTDVLLVKLGTPPSSVRDHPGGQTFDPADPDEWLANGAVLPEVLHASPTTGGPE
ncbi:MAG: DUF58 domain-containing protein [Planctomycetota bacterium]